MINPYAQSFMIAARTEHRVAPRVLASGDPKPGRMRFLRQLRRKSPRKIDPPHQTL